MGKPLYRPVGGQFFGGSRRFVAAAGVVPQVAVDAVVAEAPTATVFCCGSIAICSRYLVYRSGVRSAAGWLPCAREGARCMPGAAQPIL